MNTMPHYVTTLLLYVLCLLSLSAWAEPGVQLRSAPSVRSVCSGQTATFSLQLTSGFRQSYTLSTEGLPTGVSINFSPATIFPGGSTSLNVQTNGLSAGEYSFRAVAQAGGARVELNLELLVANGSPPLPVATSPSSGATNVFPNPVLSWTNNGRPPGTTYELQIATNISFSNMVETAEVTAMSYLPRQANNGLTTYYWRLRALSACGNSAFSTPVAFTTNNVSCQRYTNSSPIDIPEYGTSTVARSIFVGESELIAEVALEMEVDHPYLGDLSAMLVSPNGSTFQLFDRPDRPNRDFGCDQAGLYARWTDRGSQSASNFENTCSETTNMVISAANIYRPQQTFADLRNQNSRGNWTLELSDRAAADGGRLENWSLEICYQIASAPPQIVVNQALPVPRGDEATITSSYLRATQAGSNADNLTFTLTNLPDEGQLWRNNQPLGIDAQFTQADIDAGRIRYVHAGGIVLDDVFEFSIRGANGQTLAGNLFRIEIQLADLSTRLEQTAFIRCAGESTAELRVIVSGGLPPYDYALNGGPYQDSNIFDGLAAGDYQVTVLDAQDQTAVSLALSVTNPPPLTATLDLNNRRLSIAASGGTPPYTYRLNNGTPQSDPVFNGLPNGDYIVEVRDANDCVFGTTVTVAVNSLRISAAIVRPISCAGSNDGIITAIANDGAEPYEYRLNNTGAFQSNSTFFNLGPGDYQVTVRDQDGFTRTSNTVTLVEPPVLRATASVSDFTITVLGSGGTPPYMYNLSPSTSFQLTNTFTVTANGVYTLTVRDSRNCLTSTAVTVAINTLVVNTQLVSRPSCAQSSNGVLELNVSGGTPPFEYSRNGVAYQASNRFMGLAAGNYTLSVRDAEGFTRTATAYTLAAPDPLLLAANVEENILTGMASGGTPPYRYQLVGVGALQESPLFTDLPNDDYTLLVSDANGCTETTTATVSFNTLAVSTELISRPSCAQSSNGVIALNVSGGTPPFEYSRDGVNYQSSNRFSGLAAGNYTLSVRDAEGYTRIATAYMLTAPAPLELRVDVNENDLTATAEGGTPPYRYQLVGEGELVDSPVFTNLLNGEYTLRVSDANGCTETASATVLINTLVVESEVLNEISCPGAADAAIWLHVIGGRVPYSYRLNEGPWQDSPVFEPLGPGSYVLTVRDADGFIRTDLSVIVLTDPEPLEVTTVVDSNSIRVNVNGGTPPYLYSLDDELYQPSPIFRDLADAVYPIYVQDANGCRTTASSLVAYRPLEIAVVILDSLRCAGDMDARMGVEVNSSFRPYAYRLDGEDFQSDSIFMGLTAGTYTVGVRDGIGREKEIQWSLTDPPQLTLSVNVDGRTLTAFAGGGTPPYRYQLNDGPWQDSRQFTDLANGAYTISVEDAEACIQDAVASVIVATREVPIRWTLAAYPNPTRDGVTLDLPTDLFGAWGELRLLDLYGRTLHYTDYASLPEQLRLDLQQLPASVYVLELRARGRVGLVKVVVE